MSVMGNKHIELPQADPKAAEHRHDDAGSACGHHHAPAVENQTGTRLLLTLGLNLLIPVAQIIGGLIANSVALISDATHNFSDFAAILVAYLAFRIARRGASVRNTLESFGIDHPVLQFETAACGDGDLLCQLACGNGNGAHA